MKGGANPGAGKDFEKVIDKATIIQMVKDSFGYCDDAFAGLTNANALEMITVGAAPNQRQIARANQLTQLIVHGNEHYGNLVTYMRMKGIVPPSSRLSSTEDQRMPTGDQITRSILTRL